MKSNFYFSKLNRRQFIIYLTLILGTGLLLPFLNSCKVDDDDIHSKSSLTTIFLVPLDNVSASQLADVKENLKKNFADSVWLAYDFEILNGMSSPDSCLNDAKSRLRANKLIGFLEKKYGPTADRKSKKEGIDYPDYYIIGITNRDISTNTHGRDDYGILGLSYIRGHKASIVSTYRLKNKKDLWKLALHEFAHGYLAAPHCPNDDPHCILQDAKGGNPRFDIKPTFCKDCWSWCDLGD